ncbi:pimeloyl-ACP methyl ester esterase BioH [Motilimonas pumila]|uniref:Pimeloyl-[acyl-carrier protein] methyl ester esterase n=1 Tax=Motilimonas pumila TaxID=2303987 RepID=A0A418YKR9_9GAMM|nr:pimeloyl-ACP methyl ester esterase BioH [Motilimonas pumila]RJG51582.1 pimeloyl-[acyl-carrier protein] methyl ester esterase [Motilimonas pumila]
MAAAIHIESVGQGRDLVLLHGWGLNNAVWQGLVPLLSPYFRLHMVDLPGFGDSEQLPQQDLQSIANVVAANISQLTDDAVWLGWSMGGLVATKVASLYPESVRQLVLVASNPKFTESTEWHGIAPDMLAQFIDALGQDFKKTIDRFLAIQAMGSHSAKQDIKQLRAWLRAKPLPQPEALSAGLDLLYNEDLRREVVNLTQPCIAMMGRLDSLVPIKVSHDLLALNNEINILEFKQSSHAPFVTEKELFASEIIQRCLV